MVRACQDSASATQNSVATSSPNAPDALSRKAQRLRHAAIVEINWKIEVAAAAAQSFVTLWSMRRRWRLRNARRCSSGITEAHNAL